MRKTGALIVLLFGALGCSKSNSLPFDAELSAKAARTTLPPLVVILGSSTAAGYGASTRDRAWAGLLRQYLTKGNVVNLAKGGYTTYHILPSNVSAPAGRPNTDTTRNITAALKLHPTVLIVSMTTNDVANGHRVDEIMSNLKVIRQMAKTNGVRRFMVTTSHPRRINAAATRQYMEQRDRILTTYGAEAVNFFDPVADSTHYFRAELLSPDNIHPNDQGHAVLFEQIRRAIERAK